MNAQIHKIKSKYGTTSEMPAIFIGHGSPMNAIIKNEFSNKWREIGKVLPKPSAILSISAHWLTKGTFVTAMAKPKTIHDFGGFPRELYMQEYPADGSPEFADLTKKIVSLTSVQSDFGWGLDHGTWSVLLSLFPKANIPVYQMSIDYSKPIQYHYELSKQLLSLREKGVLIIGSGNLVHNLSAMQHDRQPYEWAVEFDNKIAELIESGNHKGIIDFEKMGMIANMAQPTFDHFLPLLYTLGIKKSTDQTEFFNTGFDLGSISMRSVLFFNGNA
jgi:4,5-DOPA dioxygenase extradiol